MNSKTEAVRIRTGVSLYKQPQYGNRGSPYWYARVYMPIDGRYIHTKSTRTTNQRDAVRQAEEFWADCILRKRRADDPSLAPEPSLIHESRRFDRIADGYLDQLQKAAGKNERKLRAWKDARQLHLAQNGFGAFFGKEDVTTITTKRIRDYLQFQIDQSRKGSISTTTQKKTLTGLRLILKHAQEEGVLSHLPVIPKVRQIDTPRGYFTRDEYRRLYVTAWALARQARERGDHKDQADWMEMSDFVIFMVSTFLRPSEWAAIQHKHVVVRSGAEPHLEIAAIQGKTGQRTVYSMPEAIAAYRRIVARAGDDPEGYLFKAAYLNRQTAKERMADSFKLLMRKAGIAANAFGHRRSSYSLRHSSIMFRLLEGDRVDLLVLAKNAGTSVDQIERFYGSHLSAGMRLDSLHSLKPGIRRR